MRVAITGISGYLGGLLLEALDRDPSVQSILGLDLVPPHMASSKMEFQIADVQSSDFERLLGGIDVVFHLAFIVAPPRNQLLPLVEQVNVQGSQRLFQGAIAAGVSRIIYASSIAAYGAHPDNPAGLTENDPLRPNPGWYYSRTKGQVESLVNALERQNPDTIIIRLRPGIVIGPRTTSKIKSMLKFPLIPCFQKHLKLDLCWDQDVIDAFMLALNCEKSEVFNLSGGKPLTLGDMAALLGKPALPIKFEALLPFLKISTQVGAFPRGLMEVLETGLRYSINVSAAKAKKQLGWNPRYDSPGALIELTRRLETRAKS